MSSVKLTYDNPELGGSSESTTFTGVLAVKGWYEPDEFQLHAIQHRLISGGLADDIAGLRRLITLGFGVVDTFAKRKAILYFLLDPDRVIDLVIALPTTFTATVTLLGTGSLPDDEYFYRVTAVDDVGETTGAVEDSATTLSPNSAIELAWDAMAGATGYRIYRSTTSGDYSGEAHFLAEVTTNSYTDDGSVALSSLHTLPTVQALSVVMEDLSGLRAEWMDGYQNAKQFTLRVIDKTLRTQLIP